MKSDRFRAAAEAKDFVAAEDIFTEDVVFRSPVVSPNATSAQPKPARARAISSTRSTGTSPS